MKGPEISQTELEGIVLNALFEYAQTASSKISVTEIAGRLNGEFGESRVRMAVRALDNQGDVDSSHSSYTGWHFEISEKGYKKVEQALREQPTGASSTLVPASDRSVPLNHNSAEYQSVSAGIDDLIEQVRVNNEVGETSAERSRIVQSMAAAKDLWSATELKVVQIRVGVIMAIEDAGKALEKAGKAVGWTLLVDLVRSYVKSKAGIDI